MNWDNFLKCTHCESYFNSEVSCGCGRNTIDKLESYTSFTWQEIYGELE
jgi:hypothetical protein